MGLDLAGDSDPNKLGLIVQAAREGLRPVYVARLHGGRHEGPPHAIIDQEEVPVLMEDCMTCAVMTDELVTNHKCVSIPMAKSRVDGTLAFCIPTLLGLVVLGFVVLGFVVRPISGKVDD